MPGQPSWRTLDHILTGGPRHLGVPCFPVTPGIPGLRECPSGQEDGAKLKTDVPNKQLSRRGSKKHPPPSRSRDFRTHCLFLFPTTTELRKTLFGKVSTMLVRCNSFKFKPYLCLVEKKSVQVILRQSASEVEYQNPSDTFLFKRMLRKSAAPEAEPSHYSKDGCKGKAWQQKSSQRSERC